MKIIYFEMIGSYSSALLLCLFFLLFVSNSTTTAADYDNFNGSEVDLDLWDISGDGNESENANAFTQSDGFLHADISASLRFTKLTSTRKFSGDVEFVLEFKDFQTSATSFSGGPPSLALSLS